MRELQLRIGWQMLVEDVGEVELLEQGGDQGQGPEVERDRICGGREERKTHGFSLSVERGNRPGWEARCISILSRASRGKKKSTGGAPGKTRRVESPRGAGGGPAGGPEAGGGEMGGAA